MTQITSHRIRLFIVLVSLTVLAGLLYEYLRTKPHHFYSHVIFAWTLGGGLGWALELFVLSSRYGTFIRRLHFITAIAVKTLILIGTLLFTVFIESLVLHQQVDIALFLSPDLYRAISYALLIIIGLNALMQMVRMIGGRVLVNFILGKYHQPVSEERIFLFLDIVESTALAERLGDIGIHSLITRFFFDITQPILEYGGEIHRYVGDQVVVTWPWKDSATILSAIQCVFAIEECVNAHKPSYQRRFGIEPKFRIGLHGGPVVVSECGDYKLEIVYFGDTVNTASRIEQQCKNFGCSFLISADLLNRVKLPTSLKTQSKGSVQLRGRDQEMELFTMTKQY
ncbi:MAG: adenylate/guanylate cyclase domain-containing protein [Motiliproteus sp.]